MANETISIGGWGERFIMGFFFLTIGSVIMVVFNPWNPLLEKLPDYLGRLGLIILLTVAVFVIRQNKNFEKYWQIVYALLVLTIAVSLDWIIGIYLIEYLGITDDTLIGWALPKLNECLVVVSVVIIFTKLTRNSLGSIYIQKGNLKLGITIGTITFGLAAIGSIPMAALFNANNLTLTRIVPWIPWLLIFVLANATMEEILFRGLFLRKLQPFFGRFISNFMVAFVFTAVHGLANYTADQYLFLAILFPLALAWGYIMQKTDAVWGSILFHAGMDIPILLGIFSNSF